ncbi:MAG TPA: gluconolaconase [Acidobacteriaceae bacterium]|nr:gluconolaconase [Acidobacteriaceae bacterium]
MRFSKDLPISNSPKIESATPDAALPGGEIEIRGSQLGASPPRQPLAVVDGVPVPVLLSRSNRMIVRVPEEAQSGKFEIRQNGRSSNAIHLKIARLLADNLHPVGNPAVDAQGNIYATFSGPRGQKVPVSIFRIDPSGDAQPFVSGIMNATGLAMDSRGHLYVSSRYDGTVHRVSPEGATSIYAEGMGIATGIAFDAAGNLYVGDRSGTIFKIAQDRQIFVFATLEPSIAAYHLAFGLDGTLFVAAPTTSSFDSVYAIDQDGVVRVYYRGLGRPQGLAVDLAGNLYVSASFRGRRGIVSITPSGEASLVLAGSGIVGLAFVPGGNTIVATNNAVYDVALRIEGVRLF